MQAQGGRDVKARYHVALHHELVDLHHPFLCNDMCIDMGAAMCAAMCQDMRAGGVEVMCESVWTEV